MLTRVDVQSENPFYFNIAEASPRDSIIITKIEGLDPPAVDLYMGEYARDGGFYTGRRVARRNPVLYFLLNPQYDKGETVSGLRELVYKAFLDPRPDDDELSLVLHDTEKPLRKVTGHVEKIETDIFSKDGRDIQVSMLCANPYILNLEPTEVNTSGPVALFEYPGSAETGFEMDLSMTVSSDELFVRVNSDKVFALDYPFQAGDRVLINSNRGEERIQRIRGTNTQDILYAMTANSSWPQLHSSFNSVRVYGTPVMSSDTPAVANINSLKFQATYWGV